MLKAYQESFKKLLAYFPAHWKEEFNLGYYLSTLIFLAVSVYVNYTYLDNYTVERWLQLGFGNKEWKFGNEITILFYFLFYAIPYYVTIFLYMAWHRNWDMLRSGEFWLRSFFIILVLSFDAAFYYHTPIWKSFESPAARRLGFKILGNMTSILGIFLPLFLFYMWRDRRRMNSFYGLSFKGFDYKPYVILMACMVPLVVAASYTEGFKNYYPTLKYHHIRSLEDIPIWLAYVMYETVYALDFIWTEVSFRGFMVIGMASSAGVASVGSMSSVYCYRHFAKPMGESISSIFGGYILGVIALRSNNVMGGVFVHMGIALLMEACAFYQWAI
ncbi:MAG: hypothetical protein AAFY71_26210 [Bacteroidota bacterium]